MVKIKHFSYLLRTFLLLGVLLLPVYLTDGNEMVIPTASITVDGNPDDWAGIPPTLRDSVVDTPYPDSDITNLYSKIKGSDVYLMLETNSKPIYKDSTFELNLDTKPGAQFTRGPKDDFHLNIKSNGLILAWVDVNLDGNMETFILNPNDYKVVWGDVLEAKISLITLENATYVNPTFGNLWNGLGGSYTPKDEIETVTKALPVTTSYPISETKNGVSNESINWEFIGGVIFIFVAVGIIILTRKQTSPKLEYDPDFPENTESGIEIRRGYSVLQNNDIKFSLRITNNTNYAVLDADSILDYTKTLFSMKDSEIQHLGNITPKSSRTATYILKPLGCVHNEQINALITYKDHTGKKQTFHMRPKEVHCVCPFLKEKPMNEGDYSRLAASSEFVQEGISFKGISVEELAKFMGETCRHMLYKVKEYDIDGKKVIYLSGESLGEEAYYLLTAVIQEYKGLTQVVLRAHSDKIYGLNGFMNEMADSLRHLVGSVQNAKEIGIIENTQVINIIDSVVQRTNFNMGEGGSTQVNIRDSMVQRSSIGASARKCPDCSREVEANENFCLECGAKL